MEATPLHSCLSLPKVAYMIRTCLPQLTFSIWLLFEPHFFLIFLLHLRDSPSGLPPWVSRVLLDICTSKDQGSAGGSPQIKRFARLADPFIPLPFIHAFPFLKLYMLRTCPPGLIQRTLEDLEASHPSSFGGLFNYVTSLSPCPSYIYWELPSVWDPHVWNSGSPCKDAATPPQHHQCLGQGCCQTWVALSLQCIDVSPISFTFLCRWWSQLIL